MTNHTSTIQHVFKLEVINKEVNKWDNGLGKYLYALPLDYGCEFYSKCITLNEIVIGLNELLDIHITKEALNFDCDEVGTFNVLEDEDGREDNKGSFIAMYSFTVTPIVSGLDLEQLFERGQLK